jgi:chemotaxis protein CheD
MPSPDEMLIIVGIGEYATGTGAMAAIGLGSCIALALFDPVRGIGGMAHVMLPESQGRTGRPGKFADTAVDILIGELRGLGCRNSSLSAKIAGGASMFRMSAASLNIGERNTVSVRAMLAERRIPLLAEEVGGSVGRTVTFYPAEKGKMCIRIANGAIKEI